MPIRTRANEHTVVPIGGVERNMYHIPNLGVDADSMAVGATATGVGLRRTIQDGEVRVRPTNVTATLVFVIGGAFTPPSGDTPGSISGNFETHEVIMLHNGPSGGFTQFHLRLLESGHTGINVFVNEVVDALYTLEG